MDQTALDHTADYGPEEAAMQAYLRDGEKRAGALGNRGPIRFTADGALHPEIVEAYWRCGFYIFEDVLKPDELADIERDLRNILDRLPVERGAPVDAKGRPALGADCITPNLLWSKPLGDPFGGTALASGRHQVKMFEPKAAANAPKEIVYLILGSLQFSEVTVDPGTGSVLLRAEASERVGPVHAALLDAVLARTPGAVVGEFAGRVEGTWQSGELAALGAEAAPGLASVRGLAEALVITRLHTRLGADEMTQDLELKGARPIVGGSDAHPQVVASPVLDPAMDGVNGFATRLLVRHPFAGSVACEAPRHGVWQAVSPAGVRSELRRVRALSQVERSLPLAELLALNLRLAATDGAVVGPGLAGLGLGAEVERACGSGDRLGGGAMVAG